MNCGAFSLIFDEDYFRLKGRGFSYTEEYWRGSKHVLHWFTKRLKIIEDCIKSSRIIADVGCGLAHSSRALNTIERIFNRILRAPFGLGAEIIVIAQRHQL